MLRRHTSGSVQPSSATVAFEVFGFLVRDENLQVVKIALAVVAPWSLPGYQCVSRVQFALNMLTSSFWFRSGYLLRFLVMVAIWA